MSGVKLSEVEVRFGVKNGNEASWFDFAPRPAVEGRGDKRFPREHQEAQKAPQEASKTSKRVPKNALETKEEPHQASIKQNGTPMEIK